ncbi:hypothetical protein HU200_003614 [Digitaria exilis]|uniref:Uncharacterized protein n=1 Tax=Digitaria exilis TaxID=1010633 RepID=A0A835KU74_9POAL|nr:hypothetical protein HU200_003614 [Digitaria exilis]
MAAKTARFVTEVAPAKVVSAMPRRRRKVVGLLDTIVEDEREQLMAAYGPSSSDHQAGFAAARSKRAPARERTGVSMRELSNHYFSDANGQQADGGYKLGHRRVVKI